MTPIAIRHGWRTRSRETIASAGTFSAGVIAATAGAPIVMRVVGALLFAAGAYALLDAVVLAASWRVTAHSLKIPTLISRHREISGGPEIEVGTDGRVVARLVVAGPRGTRHVRANPLVSPVDLRRWFDTVVDESARTN